MGAAFPVIVLLALLSLLAIPVLAISKRGRRSTRPAAHVSAVLFLLAGVLLGLAGGPTESILQLLALAVVVESLVGLTSSWRAKRGSPALWAGAFIAAVLCILWTVVA